MNAIDETAIRDQLERAVAVIEPVAPPLGALRGRATRRRRTRRLSGGLLAVAAVAAIVALAVVVVPGGSRDQAVNPANAPTPRSLQLFAAAHGSIGKVVGPYEGSAGWYGAFTTKAGIVLATYRSGQWLQSGPTVTGLGSGRWVMRMRFTPTLPGANGTGAPTVYVRVIGGDITYAGWFLRQVGQHWDPARFGTCGHHGLCYPHANSEPYLHQTRTGLVSVSNNCSPDCAAGTDFRIQWVWNPTREIFVAVKVTKLVN